jgi:hypothetical protein
VIENNGGSHVRFKVGRKRLIWEELFDLNAFTLLE